MYDIKELEDQWKKYRFKRTMIYKVAPLSVIGLAVVGVLLWPKISSNSFGFGGKQAQTSSQTVVSTGTETSAASSSSMNIALDDAQNQNSHQIEKPEPTKHIDIQVSPRSSEATVRDMEGRFASTNDKDDALFIATYYFDQKKYKKALKWSLEVNKIDSGIEDSWLIFAQSKYKLGARKEAIRILQAYYDRSGSEKAHKLLTQLRSGK